MKMGACVTTAGAKIVESGSGRELARIHVGQQVSLEECHGALGRGR